MEGEEPGNPVDEGKPEQGKQGFFDRFSLKLLWRMGIVTVLGLTAGFGGLDRVVPVKQVTIGEMYDNGPLQITPTRIYTVCSKAQAPDSAQWDVRSELEKSHVVLGLDVELRNTSKDEVKPEEERSAGRTYQADANIFALTDPETNSYFGWVRADGEGTAAYHIEPGKVVAMKLFWSFPKAPVASNRSIAVRVYDLELTENPNFVEMSWKRIRTFGELRAEVQGCPA